MHSMHCTSNWVRKSILYFWQIILLCFGINFDHTVIISCFITKLMLTTFGSLHTFVDVKLMNWSSLSTVIKPKYFIQLWAHLTLEYDIQRVLWLVEEISSHCRTISAVFCSCVLNTLPFFSFIVVREKEDLENDESFNPDMTHQVFGEG